MNKKFFLSIFSILSFSILLASENVDIKLGEFSKIVVTGNITLTLENSETPQIEAELVDGTTDEMFSCSVKDGVLTVKLKEPLFIGGSKIKPRVNATLGYVSVSNISVSNGAKILNDGVLEVNEITIDVNSKSTVSLNTNARDITIEAHSGSVVTISGSVEYLNVKADTNASVNTVTMTCQNANIFAATNAECYATAIKRLEARAVTKSNIFYKGSPEIEKTSKATFGNVQKF